MCVRQGSRQFSPDKLVAGTPRITREEFGDCHVEVEWATEYACPQMPQSPSLLQTDLSPGTLMIIFFLVRSQTTPGRVTIIIVVVMICAHMH